MNLFTKAKIFYHIKKHILFNKGYVNWLNDYLAEKKMYHYLMDNQLLFVHIPKCGGNSFVHSLGFDEGIGHLGVTDFVLTIPHEKFKSLYKFTIIRNPWDRLVSAYFFLKQGGWGEGDAQWFNQNLSQYEDFESFVMEWLSPKNAILHGHFTPQYKYLTIDNNCLLIDKFYKLESLTELDNDLEGYLKNPMSSTVRNASDRKPDYRTYFTNDMIQKVHCIYQRDINLFNYNYE